MTQALRYFNIDDYAALDANDRAVVDQWLRDNDSMEKVSLIQEFGDGEQLVLSGPVVDENGLMSENEVAVYKVLDENTFPWEILKKVSQ